MWCRRQTCEQIHTLLRSLINVRKTYGPSRELCGMPPLSFSQSEKALPIFTLGCRSDKNEWNQRQPIEATAMTKPIPAKWQQGHFEVMKSYGRQITRIRIRQAWRARFQALKNYRCRYHKQHMTKLTTSTKLHGYFFWRNIRVAGRTG